MIRVRWTIAVTLAAALAVPVLAQSQPSSQPPDPNAPAADAPVGTGVPSWIEQKSADSQTALKELEASLSLSQDKINKLKSDIDAMQGDRDKQNAALIAAAARVKAAETAIASVQDKIGDLIVQE